MLDASKSVDDIQQRISDEDNEDDGENVHSESDEDFMKRVKLFVAVHLHRAISSKRDDYKDNLVYQARKDVIQQFLRRAISKSCQNCGA